MSEMKVTSCDACDQIAPQDYVGGIWASRYGWVSFREPRDRSDIDACSWACSATIVAAAIAAVIRLRHSAPPVVSVAACRVDSARRVRDVHR